MGGSKKGERRGNARKRPAKSAGARDRERNRTHETPGEIMRDAATQKRCDPVTIERRIQVARIINGLSDNIEDITPKQAMLMGMWHSLQAINDFQRMLEQIATQPVTEETTAQSNVLEAEIERLWDKTGEFAFKVAGYIHPKLQAQNINITDVGANQTSILRELFDEVNELEQSRPIPIEHKPLKTG